MLSYHLPALEGPRMPLKPPYRLQIFLPEDMRAALRDIAHEERTSLQQLVANWLLEKIREYPRYHDFSAEADSGASP